VTTVQILCDNNIAGIDFLGEHGFSAVVACNAGQYLFDTGQGWTLPHNARQRGLRFDDLDGIFLSHGHYDHTGGLRWVLEQTGPINVHAHPDVFGPHLALPVDDPAKPPRDVGCPQSKEALEALGGRFVFHAATAEIAPGLWFISGYDRQPAQTPADGKLVRPGKAGPVTDPIAEDASLLVQTASGPILLLGCAHGGVLNILDHIRKRLGIKRLQAVLGGTHLMFFSPDQVRAVIAALERFEVALVGVSHCTGDMAALQLVQHFGERFRRAAAGSVFRF
jgi:7,8-dihydropterin-6-yl-methyl-4-(beta-D-ribofuranosyl)aminobenzene 5'-phosphate synthase